MLQTLRDFLLRQLDATRLLAVLGVAIGCANIIALIGVTDTAKYQTFAILRDVGANTLFITSFVETKDDDAVQRSQAMAFLDPQFPALVRGNEGIDLAAGVLLMSGHVGVGSDRIYTTIEGAEPDYPAIRGHRAEFGRFMTQADEDEGALVCCLGYELATELFPAGEDPLGTELVLKGKRFEIIGVMMEKGLVGIERMDHRVFIPLSVSQELYNTPGVHTVLARVREGADLEVVKPALEAELRSAGGLAEGDPSDFTVASVDDLTGIITSTTGIFEFLLVGISSVALLVAGIGIMNVMLMQVMGRTREIGVRRAVGARRRDIYRQFVEEAVVQTLLGTLLGVGLGIWSARAFLIYMDWVPHLTLATVLLAVLFTLMSGLLFGLYPALYASRLKPIDCLRYE
jgi:putative ABC transport system permease protein